MVETVMDDILNDTRRSFCGRRFNRFILALTFSWAWVFCAAPVPGQDKNEKPFRVEVLDVTRNSQKITVPLHRNVTIETSVEISRADIVTSEIADIQVISPRRIMITGQSYGRTMLTLMGINNQQYVLEISVELDLAEFNKKIKEIDPLSEVHAISMMGNIVLTGRVSSTERAQHMVDLAELFLPPTSMMSNRESIVQNHMTIAGEQQVYLKCIIAEVSRAATRELGINGFIAGKQAADVFFINQLGLINPIDIGAGAGVPVNQFNSTVFPLEDVFVTGGGGIPVAPATTLSFGFPKVQAQAFIRALTNNNLLKILAEPELVCLSGEQASFLAGGEFPFPESQGNQQVTAGFREFGIQLTFRPTVLGHQIIRLHVQPTVSELDFSTAAIIGGFPIPGLSTRGADTTVEVGNGQTIVIAGLLSEKVSGIASRVPGIGDVPILGALFRSVNFQRSLTELVILVTPHIVAPIEPHQKIRLPGEDLKSPSDYQLYGMGLLESPIDKNESKDKPLTLDVSSKPEKLSLHGPWGHAGSNDGR